MKTKNKTSTKPSEVPTRKVRIEFQSDTAMTVFIAGTFNDWRPNATPMIAVADRKWVKELTLAPGIQPMKTTETIIKLFRFKEPLFSPSIFGALLFFE